MLSFPNIDPIAFSMGPLVIRWYSLAYIFGVLLGYQYLKYLDQKYKIINSLAKELEDLIFNLVLGIVLGGRLGYILFYNLSFYLSHPQKILTLWEGGMSFHGGLIGFTLGVFFHARKHKKKFLRHMDILACTVPIGLFLGRIANFINGELWGHVTEVSWGVVFPYAGSLPRHPSQIYEALSEGLLSFLILFLCVRVKNIRENSGYLSAIFLICYAISRFVVEFFREPDAQLGYLFDLITMGQILSLPMLFLGLFLIFKKDNIFTKL